MGESTEISVTFNPAPRNIYIPLMIYNLGAGGNGARVPSLLEVLPVQSSPSSGHDCRNWWRLSARGYSTGPGQMLSSTVLRVMESDQ
jgi:hypothetical protein